jgi:flavin-binding protein dodecin
VAACGLWLAARGWRLAARGLCPYRMDNPQQGAIMAVAKITEIQAGSSRSFEDAIKKGIARADKTLRNVTGAWIKGQKVVINKGKITEYRVLLKVTFVLSD